MDFDFSIDFEKMFFIEDPPLKNEPVSNNTPKYGLESYLNTDNHRYFEDISNVCQSDWSIHDMSDYAKSETSDRCNCTLQKVLEKQFNILKKIPHYKYILVCLVLSGIYILTSIDFLKQHIIIGFLLFIYLSSTKYKIDYQIFGPYRIACLFFLTSSLFLLLIYDWNIKFEFLIYHKNDVQDDFRKYLVYFKKVRQE